MGILIKEYFQCNTMSLYSDDEGCFMNVDLEISDVHFKLMKLYIPYNSVERTVSCRPFTPDNILTHTY